MLNNGNTQGWTTAVSKAAMTLLLAAVVVFIAWTIFKIVLVPLVIIVALIGIIRMAVLGRHHTDW
jgi:hypothetical protein